MKERKNNPNDKFSVKLVLQRGNPGQCVGYVLNMDETPVWFEMPGKSTLAERGGKEVRVATTGHEKERLTVTLAAMLTEQNYLLLFTYLVSVHYQKMKFRTVW